MDDGGRQRDAHPRGLEALGALVASGRARVAAPGLLEVEPVVVAASHPATSALQEIREERHDTGVDALRADDPFRLDAETALAQMSARVGRRVHLDEELSYLGYEPATIRRMAILFGADGPDRVRTVRDLIELLPGAHSRTRASSSGNPS